MNLERRGRFLEDEYLLESLWESDHAFTALITKMDRVAEAEPLASGSANEENAILAETHPN